MHKEIVISHFLHPSLNQVEVGRVGVERVSEVAMVTEEEREGRGGGGGGKGVGGGGGKTRGKGEREGWKGCVH